MSESNQLDSVLQILDFRLEKMAEDIPSALLNADVFARVKRNARYEEIVSLREDIEALQEGTSMEEIRQAIAKEFDG